MADINEEVINHSESLRRINEFLSRYRIVETVLVKNTAADQVDQQFRKIGDSQWSSSHAS